ncbi:MAG: TIR domain-containing protein, partial [Pyrinomonadaceae bacterium]
MNRYFISYSPQDGLEFALRLRDELEAGTPSVPVWLDRRDLQVGQDWDATIVEALKTCLGLIFVMTRDSVEDESVCKREWTYALRYKKPIIPLKLHADAEMPFRLAPRQHIDFTRALESDEEFNAALARLSKHLEWLASPEGTLQALKDRLADAQRDMRRAKDPAQQARIGDDIEQLKKDVAKQGEIVHDPKGVARRVDESIKTNLERERGPERPADGAQRGKFINPPPGLAPNYFQNRHVETEVLGSFLKDDAVRLITVAGRGGTGKTALICRLLKSLEGGQLPDDGGPLEVDGIVYLSAAGSRRVNFTNLYYDLSKLLPKEAASHLDALFRNPQASTESKISALLSNFASGRTVVLLDNFDDLIDRETLNIIDAELEEALRALLDLPHHTVKVILTTRVVSPSLALFQPGRQRRLDLDEGLASPYAENILREMDADGKVGLKYAPDDLLSEARERTRGYPRALEALFAILSADRGATLRDILDDTTKILPENVVRELVGEAFNRLDITAQQVMQALAVYGRPVTQVAVDYLLAPYLPGADCAPVLKRLVNMRFARREVGRYKLDPIDRAYALSRIPADEPDGGDEDAAPPSTEAPPFTLAALMRRAAEYFTQLSPTAGQQQTPEVMPAGRVVGAEISDRLSYSSQMAFRTAEALRSRLRSDQITTEILLAALFQKSDGPTRRVLTLYTTQEDVRVKLEGLLEDYYGNAVRLDEAPAPEDVEVAALPVSNNVQTVLNNAMSFSARTEMGEGPAIRTRHLLAALISTPGSVAGAWMEDLFNVSQETLAAAIHNARDFSSIPELVYALGAGLAGAEVLRRDDDAAVTALTFAPGGELLAAGYSDSSVVVWDTQRGNERLRLSLRETALALAFSPDASRLAVGDAGSGVRIWNLPEVQYSIEGEKRGGVTRALTFSPNGRQLLVLSDDYVELFETVVLRAPLSFDSERPITAFFSREASHIYVVTADGDIKRYPIPSVEGAKKQTGEEWLEAVPVGGESFLAVRRDGVATLWNAELGEAEQSYNIQLQILPVIQWTSSVVMSASADGRHVAGVARDRSVKVWSLNDGREVFSHVPDSNASVAALA